MADGPSRLTGALASEDTEVMIEALRSIGVMIDVSEGGRTLTVTHSALLPEGPAGSPPMPDEVQGDPIELYIANSGTSIRFLTAVLSAFGGRYRLHGVDRMHQRPIGDLVDAIRGVI
jgi:3-phosphoshikimate 1-carboxyvinyltransferase